MSVNWTREQKQVIENRGSNLLVAAAAGSGKTAVLVERIIRMITEGSHPLDIDRLLVMTFTNAAAAEMRERISAAINKKLEETPKNAHLQAQAALVHHARITTIDSFCLDLIRNYFNRLDLDPSFRVGDEGELLLLRGDVMRKLLEDYYAEGSEEFIQFVQTYAPGKSDAGIEDYIMQVYTFAQSNPYPGEWFRQCREEADASPGECKTQGWMRFLMEDVRRQALELAQQLREALEICREDEYLCAYAPMFSNDLTMFQGLAGASDFEELHGLLSSVAWTRLAAVRSKEVDQEKKAYVTGCRDRAKKAVAKLQESYAFASVQEMYSDMEKAQKPVRMLIRLAEDFSRRYQEKKREKNLVDFGDLEHEALNVLIACEDGRPLKNGRDYVYTEAADELSRQYEEVLVDEYQDSNLVQETLMHAVSRERFKSPNLFMVGDVKQSIYKFRLARPELFLEKYHSYEPAETAGDGPCRKIELHQNFRSRAEVLGGINDVFFRIMTEGIGNIRYTEETALHAGAEFAPAAEYAPGAEPESATEKTETSYIPELLVTDTGTAALGGLDDEAADYTAKEIEAKLIVRKIREMTDPKAGLMVWDKQKGRYRTARWGDMVILLRSMSGWAETLLAVLMNEGIPAYAESQTGYFNTMEVETVLSFLSVIDNPMQDIPLAAVLRSPIVGMDDEELALMMADYRGLADPGQDRGIYAAMKYAAADRPYSARIERFRNLLQEFRRESKYLPIHELIYHVYERTGYYSYVSAMPAGAARRANLDMLVEKAAAYEKTSYTGLFHFVRYVENLKKYDTDFGEASALGEDEDTVRIMSIHKSKGLEFPIVFLAGMGKKFNRQDTYRRLLIDPELGIAADYLDLQHRLKTTTLKKQVLRRRMDLENMGEELRILYVAMTRAKEKLVMTGTDRYLARSMEKYAQVPLTDEQIPYTILGTAGSYLDWMLMCVGDDHVRIRMEEIPAAELVGEELVRQIEKHTGREALLAADLRKRYDEDFGNLLREHLEYQYPHAADIILHTKMSVSELKKQGQLADETESVCQNSLPEQSGALNMPEQSGPKRWFSPEEQPPDGGYGATRGTAYHRALELLSFDELESREDVEASLHKLADQKKYAPENLELIDSRVIWRFLQSDLGRRMAAAAKAGTLHKEQQFVMGIPAREMGAGESDELVVIQGIIDAYFEEEDGLVLADYKTDRVRSADILIEHYKKQLDYYERALNQMTGKKVKQKLIYSLTLQREIEC